MLKGFITNCLVIQNVFSKSRFEDFLVTGVIHFFKLFFDYYRIGQNSFNVSDFFYDRAEIFL